MQRSKIRDKNLLSIVRHNGSCGQLPFSVNSCEDRCYLYNWCYNSKDLGSRDSIKDSTKREAIKIAIEFKLITEEEIFDKEL